jgi:ABC-type sugar transport system ATPase subunit
MDMKVVELSGGNQQKVVIGGCLASDPNIIILDEPTRGIDVGAKAEIYRIINNLAKNGSSIIFISSDMPEIINMCDRVIVMAEGVVTAELIGADINQETIMKNAVLI